MNNDMCKLYRLFPQKQLAKLCGQYYNLVGLFDFAVSVIRQEREFGYGERPEMGKICRAYGALL